MAKYFIRPPFSVHLAWFETQKQGGVDRKIRREQSFFYGENEVELKDADAIAHMHKLEPADAEAKRLFKDIHEKQQALRASRQGGESKSLVAQVTESVIGALIAAGVIKPGNGAKA